MAVRTHRANRAKSANPPIRETGTDLAIYSTCQSDGTFPPKGRWGGARNSASRVSRALTLRQAVMIQEHARQAFLQAGPLNRFVTIHWERAGIPDAMGADATGRLLKLARDWMRAKGAVASWAWVRENAGDKGSHVHILLACPAGLPIGRMWRRWLRKVTGQPYRKGIIKSRTIGPSLLAGATNPAAYLASLAAVLAYMCKGILPADADLLGLPDCADQGPIIGKRAGVSASRQTRRR